MSEKLEDVENRLQFYSNEAFHTETEQTISSNPYDCVAWNVEMNKIKHKGK